jgi:cbb3-type cytochrome oxidase subunit 3
MLETIIKILTYINQKKWASGMFSYIFGLLLLLVVGNFWLFTLGNEHSIDESTVLNYLFKITSVILILSAVKCILKNYKAGLSQTTFFSDVLTRVVPILVSFGALYFIIDEKSKIKNLFEIENIAFALPLLALYSILDLVSSIKTIREKGLFQKIFSFSRKYNIGIIIIIAVILLLGVFSDFIKGLSYSHYHFDDTLLILFWLVPLFIFGGIIFSSLLSNLKTPEERNLKSILKSGLLGFIISLLPFFVIWGSSNFSERQITKAEKILREEGENQFGFKKVQDIYFLKKAFISQYKERGSAYSKARRDLFTKIFDDTLENSIQSEVDMEKFRNLRSNETSALAKDENAAVLLNYAEYESVFYPKANALETKITYEFQNTENSNQEVIFNIRLPKSESVVTNLKLGLNLEKQGLVAPRGAAEKVYQESMRRRIDPALISQIGPNLYRLRVYPVLSKTDRNTQGRQKVQISYLTPLNINDEIITAPAIETLNLSITETTKAVIRVKQDGALISENEVNKNQEQFFVSSQSLNKTLPISGDQNCLALNDLENYFLTPLSPIIDQVDSEQVLKQKQEYLIRNLPARNKQLDETIVFFDISKSVKKHDQIRDIYKEIVSVFKDQSLPFQVKTYNFEIYPATSDIDSFEFWGYTDTGKIIDYLNNNKISGKRILIVTDDTNFEFNTQETKNIDYQSLNSNVISVLQVGKKIRAQKDVITKSVLATGGVVAVLDSVQDVAKSKDAIMYQNQFSLNFENCVSLEEKSPDRKILEKIQAGQISNILLAQITNQPSWMQVAQKSANLAQRYQIANLFSSYIALETQQQKNDLERYSKESGRYDVDYENFDNMSSAPSVPTRSSGTITFNNPMSYESVGPPVGWGQPISGDAGSLSGSSASGIISTIVAYAITIIVVVFIIIFIAGYVGMKRQEKKANANLEKKESILGNPVDKNPSEK